MNIDIKNKRLNIAHKVCVNKNRCNKCYSKYKEYTYSQRMFSSRGIYPNTGSIHITPVQEYKNKQYMQKSRLRVSKILYENDVWINYLRCSNCGSYYKISEIKENNLR
jgi:hypothetical protein